MDLSKKKILYINGCSHSLGSEIQKPGIGWATVENLRWCYGGQIAHKYNLRDVNHSCPGGSNERIYRTSIDWLCRYISSGRDPRDLFCIFGWTVNDRYEFFYDKDNKWYQWSSGMVINKSMKKFKPLFKQLTTYVISSVGGAMNRIINTISLSSFLEKYNIDYVMLNNWENQWEGFFEKYNLSHLKEVFPFKNYFEPYDGFINQYMDKKEYKKHFSRWFHADKYIHTLYAEKLDKFIREEL